MYMELICTLSSPFPHQLNDVFSARALLAFGCEVNCLNPVNTTPLDIACDLHREGEIIDLLVSVGGQKGQGSQKQVSVCCIGSLTVSVLITLPKITGNPMYKHGKTVAKEFVEEKRSSPIDQTTYTTHTCTCTQRQSCGVG